MHHSLSQVEVRTMMVAFKRNKKMKFCHTLELRLRFESLGFWFGHDVGWRLEGSARFEPLKSVGRLAMSE